MNGMKKLKSLRLENFQSHKDLYVEFSDGLNIITGTNNAGKTAIFRALDYIYNFGKKVMAILTLHMYLTKHHSAK